MGCFFFSTWATHQWMLYCCQSEKRSWEKTQLKKTVWKSTTYLKRWNSNEWWNPSCLTLLRAPLTPSYKKMYLWYTVGRVVPTAAAGKHKEILQTARESQLFVLDRTGRLTRAIIVSDLCFSSSATHTSAPFTQEQSGAACCYLATLASCGPLIAPEGSL